MELVGWKWKFLNGTGNCWLEIEIVGWKWTLFHRQWKVMAGNEMVRWKWKSLVMGDLKSGPFKGVMQ